MREERADMFKTLRITRDKIQLSTHCNGDNLDGSDHGDEDKSQSTSYMPITPVQHGVPFLITLSANGGEQSPLLCTRVQ